MHEVKTDDGYILTMHRIPEGKTNKGGNRPPVYLQHGLLMSSVDWIINRPDNALGKFIPEMIDIFYLSYFKIDGLFKFKLFQPTS